MVSLLRLLNLWMDLLCGDTVLWQGHDIVVVDSPVGRLDLTVSYDLRFPELYQLLRFQQDAQVLLVPAAFTRVTGEAHFYVVVAAAQARKHNEKRESYGDSLIIDPWRRITARLPDHLSTGIAIADIDLSNIVRIRMPISEHQKLGAWRKASCL
ncbi:deaminated glutathione amidase, chloroplastic/cytosolic-like isoform X1 [Dioscorea cayenensis subsp. rotundata]|uniref:Deaminated glutathione amidase, chloroplastic/cytosolic-like isoform X1 n=1 Tax=Dioscorea cayennensis subsp. rotundata TaxID=55577 RepID=A0AB40C9Y9_DIOCR|nr:deaminated glutathione amidase, chloroplastic/cytosolic-like isoform X1 [Dioscorea cayenensis subsp. rotundata]